MTQLISVDRAASRIGANPWILEAAIYNHRLTALTKDDCLFTTHEWLNDWLTAPMGEVA